MKIRFLVLIVAIMPIFLFGKKTDINGEIVWKHQYKEYEKLGNVLWRLETPKRKFFWSEAKKYCKKLPTNGTTKWRLASVKEFSKIKSYEIRKRTNTYGAYWSSTYLQPEHKHDYAKAYVVNVTVGKKNILYKETVDKAPHYTRSKWNWHEAYLKCVRTADFKSYNIWKETKKKAKKDIKEKQKLSLPKKPKNKPYPNMTKGEFEKTVDFNKRVKDKKAQIDEQNQRAIKQWKEKTKELKQSHKKFLKSFDKNEIYLRHLQNAFSYKYGNPKVKNVKYDADSEKFKFNLISSNGNYNKQFEIPVKIEYAKKFKAILVDKNFKPTVEYEVKNNKLIFKAIKEVKDPDLLVQENEYEKAYMIKDDIRSLVEIAAFIKKYPNSKLLPKAKKRKAQLEEKIKIKAEKDRQYEERSRQRAMKQQMENDKRDEARMKSYNSRKNVGDKICKRYTGLLGGTVEGYVQKVQGNKIEIRISNADGISGYNYNGIKWEHYTDWYRCNYY